MTISEYRKNLKEDRRNSKGMNHIKYYFFSDGYKVVSSYRKCQLFRSLSQTNALLKPIEALLRYNYRNLCRRMGIDMPSSTVIGPGFVLYHTHGVAINGDCIIGKNVEIGANVVLGTRRGKCPVIEDNVSIGAGAIIIGETVRKLGHDQPL